MLSGVYGQMGPIEGTCDMWENLTLQITNVLHMNALDVSSMCTAMAAALEAGIGRQIGYFCKEEGDSVQLCSNKLTAAQLKDGWLPKVLPQDTLEKWSEYPFSNHLVFL